MRRILNFIGVIVFFTLGFVSLTFAQEERITITTYYPSPYGSYRDLVVHRRLAIGNDAGIWINDPVTETTDGMYSSDAAIFVPVYTGAETSDLRLYILDNGDDKFSIWGNSCQGDCRNLNSASNIATFMANGNVGIGTTNPARQLHVVGNNAVIRLDRDVDGPAAIFVKTAPNDFSTIWKTFAVATKGTGVNQGTFVINDLGTDTGGGGTTRFTINNNGNVGIGTTNPEGIFEVVGRRLLAVEDRSPPPSGTFNDMAMIGSAPAGGTDGTANIEIYGPHGQGGFGAPQVNEIFYDANLHHFRRAAAGADLVTILQNGNVGIGASTPVTHVEIAGTTDQVIAVTKTSGNIRTFIGSATQPGWNYGAIGTYTNHPLFFFTNGASRMVIHANGQIAMGPVAGVGNGTLNVWATDKTALVLGSNPINPASYYALSVSGGNVYINGNVEITGRLSKGSGGFVQPYPKDPTKEIVYTFLEGRDSRIFFDGVAPMKNGQAVIEVPEDFRLVASSKRPLNVILTPFADDALYVKERSLEHIIVVSRDKKDTEFGYLVIATRAGFEESYPIQDNTHFRPNDNITAEDFEKRFSLSSGNNDPYSLAGTRLNRELLISNGILDKDGKLNLGLMKKLGWKYKENPTAEDSKVKSPVLLKP